MENKDSLFELILIAAFFYILFFTPLGWIALILFVMVHLHPVYWLYRIAKAIENNKE